jgi:hypothetical protein
MTLDDARTAILAALGRMNAAYTQPVFDEWVLVSLKADRGAILAYHGPRAESYKKTFTADIQPLRSEVAEQKLAVGDFAFVAAATGSKHDACMRIGAAGFLFCNHTVKSMAEIRQSPLWRVAQKPFVELSDKFRADPLE